MTALAPNPQKTMFKAAAFEVGIELPLDIARQCTSLRRQYLPRGQYASALNPRPTRNAPRRN